ncbi:hypothetical protein AB3X52_05505 [Nocardioides sp. DS6]|uniref:Uncharacterized protein n=1 Tax=Nocardioides eburneus TaxID=3231482 RepID=A0ABV3SVW3_9ACTN
MTGARAGEQGEQSGWAEVDPFDLPDWLGTTEVVWSAPAGIHTGHLVAGELRGGDDPLACDLLAVDEAYPSPVADERLRRAAHQAWRRGEVCLVERGTRLTLAVPGSAFVAERVLDTVSRLACSVGAAPSSYAVLLGVA